MTLRRYLETSELQSNETEFSFATVNKIIESNQMANAQPLRRSQREIAKSCQTLPRHRKKQLLDLTWGNGKAIFPEPHQNFDLPTKDDLYGHQSLHLLQYVSPALQRAAGAINPHPNSEAYKIQNTHGDSFIEDLQKELNKRSNIYGQHRYDIVQTEKSVFGFEGNSQTLGSRENLLSMPEFANWRRSTCTLEKGIKEIEQKLARTDRGKQIGIIHVTQTAERSKAKPIPNSPMKTTIHVHQVMLLLFKTGRHLTKVVLFDAWKVRPWVRDQDLRAWTYAAMKYLGADKLYRLAGEQTLTYCCTIYCEALIRALMAGVEIKDQHCFQIQRM